MSQIYINKELYSQNLTLMNMAKSEINTYLATFVSVGENESSAITEFMSIYDEIKSLVQDYKWAFDDIYTSFEKAGKALIEADQKLASGIMDCTEYI